MLLTEILVEVFHFYTCIFTLVEEERLFNTQRGAPRPPASPICLNTRCRIAGRQGVPASKDSAGALGLSGSLWYVRSLKKQHLSPLGRMFTRPCARVEETELSSENPRSRGGAGVGGTQAQGSSTGLPSLGQGPSPAGAQGRVARWSLAESTEGPVERCGPALGPRL